MNDEEQENKGFKVTDRRSFTAEGDLRETTSQQPFASERVVSPDPAPTNSDEPPPRSAYPHGGDAQDLRFLDLLSLIATQALVQLGEPNPMTGESRTDLAGARIMISFLEVLKDKTKGNLTQEEARALDELLYDLRMRFVAKAKVAQ